MRMTTKAAPPKASADESGVTAPQTVTVDYQPKPVIYLSETRVLVRRAGY